MDKNVEALTPDEISALLSDLVGVDELGLPRAKVVLQLLQFEIDQFTHEVKEFNDETGYLQEVVIENAEVLFTKGSENTTDVLLKFPIEYDETLKKVRSLWSRFMEYLFDESLIYPRLQMLIFHAKGEADYIYTFWSPVLLASADTSKEVFIFRTENQDIRMINAIKE